MSDGNNQELKLHIVSDADTKGFTQMSAAGSKLKSETSDLSDETRRQSGAVNELEEATKKSAEATEQDGLSKHELRKVLLDIGNVAAPGAGRALSELAFGPIGAALALVGVYEILKDKIDDFDKDLDAQGANAAEAFSNIKANLYDAIRDEEFNTDKIDAYFKKIEDDANHAKTAIDNALALTKAKDSAAQEVNRANEQLDLERIKNNTGLTDAQKETATATAKDYYAKENARLEKDQNSAELKSARDERDALQQQLDGLLFRQNKENSVTPEKQGQIDRAISQLDPADALRVQYEKDKAAGTIDYAKISSDTAKADTATQLENLKKKLGLDPQTGAMADGGDAKRAADKNSELQKQIDKINHRIADVQEIVNTSKFANERQNAQAAVDFYKTQRAPLQAEMDANNAGVKADKRRIDQLENAAKIIADGADEQKKLNDAIAATKAKVDAASAKVDLITQTTGIKNATIDTVLKTNEQTGAENRSSTELQADKGIADKVVSGQSTSNAYQQRLIAAASKIAGHQVDLNTAANIIETGARNVGVLVDQIGRLAQAMSQFNPAQITRMQSQLDAIQRQVGSMTQSMK